jgi:hypothetical protein
MTLKLLYTVLISLFVAEHPFHISVCDIEYDAESKALQISQRIFMDDLEDGLKAFHKLESVDAYKPKDAAALDKLIDGYLKAKLFIRIDGKNVDFEFLGSELEGDARWSYLEVKGIEGVSEAEISNLVLTESFEDQENIVHMKVNGKLKSHRLSRDEKVVTFKFKQ